MLIRRRSLLATGAATAGLAALGPARLLAQPAPDLASMTGDVVPISRDEHLARVARAQRLMGEAGLSALLIEPGASMIYFTGIHWHLSERLTAAIIPASGEPCIVTPHFEEPSVRESLRIAADVRVWNEDDYPLRTVAAF